MADKTAISWTDATWNPVRGCSRVSPGCVNCYAERTAGRFGAKGQPYHGLVQLTGKGARWTGKVRMVAEHLADPLRWQKPRRIFVNSMSDLFHESLSNESIAAVFGVMGAAPRHTFQVLTKRAERMHDWFEWVIGATKKFNFLMPARYCAKLALEEIGDPKRRADAVVQWPLPNVWLGVSVENQKAADDRIPWLLETPAAVRFLSCEPLLGPLDLSSWLIRPLNHISMLTGEVTKVRSGLHWVIAGCESGPGARLCDTDWLRSLRDQCVKYGQAFFLKQAVTDRIRPGLSVYAPESISPFPGSGHPKKPNGVRMKAGDVIELPYLDGHQHVEFPA